jgi:DNA-binding response OmpR family regulator
LASILLIEPDMVLAITMREYLESLNHHVQWRSDAQSSINSADETAPDLVILELQLAQHSGMDFLYEFRSYPEWQHVPIIILSSIAGSEIETSSIMWQQLEVVAYYYKPETKLSYVGQTVAQALELSRS